MGAAAPAGRRRTAVINNRDPWRCSSLESDWEMARFMSGLFWFLWAALWALKWLFCTVCG